MEESLGNPRDSLYFKGFHGTIYSNKNNRHNVLIYWCF